MKQLALFKTRKTPKRLKVEGAKGRRRPRPRKAVIKGAIFRVIPPNCPWADEEGMLNTWREEIMRVCPRTRNGLRKQIGKARIYCAPPPRQAAWKIRIEISYDQGESWRPISMNELAIIEESGR